MTPVYAGNRGVSFILVKNCERKFDDAIIVFKIESGEEKYSRYVLNKHEKSA